MAKIEIGDKAGMIMYKFTTPMVNTKTKKFAGFIHSNVVEKDRFVLDKRRETCYTRYGKKQFLVYKKGVKPGVENKAIKECENSMDVKIKRFMRKGYTPLRQGWIPFNKHWFCYEKKKKPKLRIVDTVITFNTKKSIEY